MTVSVPAASRTTNLEGARRFLQIAIPVGIEAGIQRLFLIIEQALIAKIDLGLVGGAGVINNILYMVLIVLIPLGVAGSILISQASGKNDPSAVRSINHQTVLLSLIASVLIAAALAFGARDILQFYAVDDSAVPGTYSFFLISLLVCPLMVTGTAMATLLRVVGLAKTSLWISTISLAAANVLTVGIVYSDFASEQKVVLVCVAILVGYIIRFLLLSFFLWRSLAPRGPNQQDQISFAKSAAQLCRLALPLSGSKVLWISGLAIYTLIFSREGTGPLAVSQIVIVFQTTFIMLASGVPVAANALVGNALGAENRALARAAARSVLWLSGMTSVGMALLMMLSMFLLPIFYGALTDVEIRLALLCSVITALTIPIIVLNMALGSGIVASGGDTKFLFGVDVVAGLIVGIPLAFGLWHFTSWGIAAVFVARAAEEGIRLAFTFARYQTGRWITTLDIR